MAREASRVVEEASRTVNEASRTVREAGGAARDGALVTTNAPRLARHGQPAVAAASDLAPLAPLLADVCGFG